MESKGNNGKLIEFHGLKMDGFDFCKKANECFEVFRAEPDGINRLRLRKDRKIKKFSEEVLPLAHYIRRIYSLGLKLEVKWVDGDQNYDAVITASGTRVSRNKFPKKRYLEITSAINQNDYLVREHLTKNGFAYSPNGMSRDPKTRQTISKPVVRTNNEHISDLANNILKRIEEKALKTYPKGTDLLIQCKGDTLIYDYEWNQVAEIVAEKKSKNKFGTITIMDMAEDQFTVIQRPKDNAW